MAASTISLVVGWTAELPAFTLKANGTVLNLTGFTDAQIVAKIKRTGSATYLDTEGNVRIDADPTTGKVYYKPDAGDFPAAGTYDLRFQVTDGDGDVEFFPNGVPNSLIVYLP
jgi:hypothetical protein